MPIDSFKYLPRSFHAEYETVADAPEDPVWAPLATPVAEATISLLTSAGLYLKDSQEPFDVERERNEPTWGDPTYRIVPRTVRRDEIGATHLHINTDDLVADFNIALPIAPLEMLAAEGTIGAVADDHYSFMGYQSRGLAEWRDRYGPEVVAHLQEGAVDAVILAPA